MRARWIGLCLLGVGCANPLSRGVLEVTTPKDTDSAVLNYRTSLTLEGGGQLLWLATSTSQDKTAALLSLQVTGRALPNQCREVSLFADGERVPLGVVQLRSDMANTKAGRRSTNGPDELRAVIVPAQSAALLAAAGSIGGTVCGVKYGFSETQRENFFTFVEKAGLASAPAPTPAPTSTPAAPE